MNTPTIDDVFKPGGQFYRLLVRGDTLIPGSDERKANGQWFVTTMEGEIEEGDEGEFRREITALEFLGLSEPPKPLLSEAREHARLLELTLRQLGQLHPESVMVFTLLANQANGIASACLELGDSFPAFDGIKVEEVSKESQIDPGDGWELLPKGAQLQSGDGFFHHGDWIDYQFRPDIFRGGGEIGSWYYFPKNDTAHTYPWRRRKVEEAAK